MLCLYRLLLNLYPRTYLDEFGEEMLSVYLQAKRQSRRGSFGARLRFSFREIGGLLAGSMRERLRDRTLLGGNMRQFRFPFWMAVLMTTVLVGVVMVIEEARIVSISLSAPGEVETPAWAALLGVLAAVSLLMMLVGAIGYGLLLILRRTGIQRLSGVRTWPVPK